VRHGNLHRARGAFAIGRRRGHMVGIGGKSVSGQLAINLRAARLRVFQLFDDNDASALAHDKSVAVPIERP
jgi:hypothetical protein